MYNEIDTFIYLYNVLGFFQVVQPAGTLTKTRRRLMTTFVASAGLAYVIVGTLPLFYPTPPQKKITLY